MSNNYEGCASSEIEQRSYYWLEVDNNSYVLYFDKSLEFHKRAFLLLVAVPGANKESWFDQSTCQLLADAFDNFYKKSCFFSFIPNKQSEKFYEFSINFLGAEIFGELEIEETITVVRTDSELKKMTVCSSLLEKVQIGTRFWNQFYKVEDKFVETYYVLYGGRVVYWRGHKILYRSLNKLYKQFWSLYSSVKILRLEKLMKKIFF